VSGTITNSIVYQAISTTVQASAGYFFIGCYSNPDSHLLGGGPTTVLDIATCITHCQGLGSLYAAVGFGLYVHMISSRLLRLRVVDIVVVKILSAMIVGLTRYSQILPTATFLYVSSTSFREQESLNTLCAQFSVIRSEEMLI